MKKSESERRISEVPNRQRLMRELLPEINEIDLLLAYLWNHPKKLPTQPSTWAKRTFQRRLPSPRVPRMRFWAETAALLHHPDQPSISTQKHTSITTHTYVVVWVVWYVYVYHTNMKNMLLHRHAPPPCLCPRRFECENLF